MTSILEAATPERVREAYRKSGALPRARITLHHDGADLYACPIGALAIAADPAVAETRTLEIPDALEVAGIDDDEAVDGFVDGFDGHAFIGRPELTPPEWDRYRAGVAHGAAIARAVFAE